MALRTPTPPPENGRPAAPGPPLEVVREPPPDYDDGAPPVNPQTADPAALIEHLTHFQRRVLQDALNEASARYWTNRATQFDWAAEPATGDRRRRLQATAQACRAAATLAPIQDTETPTQRRETILWQQRLARTGQDTL